MSKYVIIGGSIAAVGTIEGIRSVDKTGDITLVTDENHFIYSRPLISYLVEGKTTLEKMRYREDDFYIKNNVDVIKGVVAEKIDYENKCIVLNYKRNIPFEKLMIATGSSPFTPHIEGEEKVKNRFTFMSLDDALNLEKAINKDSKVLILGAGLIGLKCAEAINAKVKSVTVVDLADRILPSILDEKGCKLVQRYIEKQGVKFILGNSIDKIDEKEATLKDGSKLDYDIFVVAVGVRPNVGLAKEIGCEVNRGIITDEHGMTTVKDVYAAGDCTESYDITRDQNIILALLPNAYFKGETAGVNMAGGEKSYKNAMPMNSLGLFGLHMVTAGNYDGEEYVVESENEYKKLVYKDNLLKGFIIIGDVDKAGIYTYLIREKINLNDIDFDLVKDHPGLMAFSRDYRDSKLGGKKL